MVSSDGRGVAIDEPARVLASKKASVSFMIVVEGGVGCLSRVGIRRVAG